MCFCVRVWSVLESRECNLKYINCILALTRYFVLYICKMGKQTILPLLHVHLLWALARVSCNHVIKCAAWSPEQCIYTLSSAGTGIPSRVCLYHPPYGGSSLVFCCPSAWEVHQTLESNLSTALFLLYCDISLSGQSDKSHMASLHERTTAASSRCCSADCS